MLGASASGVTAFHYMPEPNQMAEQAADRLGGRVSIEPVASPRTTSALDTECAAQAMRDAGCTVVITLGGDGTNRAAARGWREMPVIPISTGTNNVFPSMVEGTAAGLAAGLVASGAVSLENVARVSKTVTVRIEEEEDDLALIDAALLDGAFLGSRAIWSANVLRTFVLTRADPAGVGLTSIGGLVHPVGVDEDAGLLIRCGDGEGTVTAPVAPGLMEPVPLAQVDTMAMGDTIDVTGPGVLAFDGERERRLKPGQRSTLTLGRNGPHLIDVQKTMHIAACEGLLRNVEVPHGD